MLELDLWRVHGGWNVSSLNISGVGPDGEPAAPYAQTSLLPPGPLPLPSGGLISLGSSWLCVGWW